MTYLPIFFFFSSRRRHTRWPRDWSSDVCSSDLSGGDRRGRRAVARLAREGRDAHRYGAFAAQEGRRIGRSEERRVGKECRCQGASDHDTTKKKREYIVTDPRPQIHRLLYIDVKY